MYSKRHMVLGYLTLDCFQSISCRSRAPRNASRLPLGLTLTSHMVNSTMVPRTLACSCPLESFGVSSEVILSFRRIFCHGYFCHVAFQSSLGGLKLQGFVSRHLSTFWVLIIAQLYLVFIQLIWLIPTTNWSVDNHSRILTTNAEPIWLR